MKCISFSFLALSTLLLAGCPKFVYLQVYNNTGFSIQLSNNEEIKTIAPASKTTVEYNGKITIISEAGYWSYDRKVPIRRDADRFLKDHRILTVQIEPDGYAYAVSIDSKLPIYDFNNQPEGYPLSPSESSPRAKQ